MPIDRAIDLLDWAPKTFDDGYLVQWDKVKKRYRGVHPRDALTVNDLPGFNQGYGFVWTPSFGLAAGTPATVGTNKTAVVNLVPFAGRIVKALIWAEVGPTGADLICDVNCNGTSIWDADQSNRIKIVAGAQSGLVTTFDTVDLIELDRLTIDVDQIGSVLAGQSITVELVVLLKNQ